MKMINFLPLKKIVKMFLSKRKKRDKTLSSLSNCFDKEKQNKRRTCRLLCISILMLLFLCCIGSKLSENTAIIKYFYDGKAVSREELTALINGTLSYPKRNISVYCRVNEYNSGNVTVNKIITNTTEIQYPNIMKGGYYVPDDCISRHKVAILVPYRNRQNHLSIFLNNIHPFLMKQRLEYRVFVIEQYGSDIFNRGKLFNAGYEELKRFGRWRCVVFHDVDLLPVNERSPLYTCPTWPRHMFALDVLTGPSLHSLFGGVAVISPEHFEKVNGYSNLYWGWGGEDCDLFSRMKAVGYPILQYSKDVGQYTSLKHTAQPRNRRRYRLLLTARKRYEKEGLNTLDYKLVSMTCHHLYTLIVVDINPNKKNISKILAKWL